MFLMTYYMCSHDIYAVPETRDFIHQIINIMIYNSHVANNISHKLGLKLFSTAIYSDLF